jgi:hypothetical protein
LKGNPPSVHSGFIAEEDDHSQNSVHGISQVHELKEDYFNENKQNISV